MGIQVRALLLILITGFPLSGYVARRTLTPSGLAFEKWADSSFPILWRSNPAKRTNIAGLRDVADVVRLAFQAWSNVSTARSTESSSMYSNIRKAAVPIPQA